MHGTISPTSGCLIDSPFGETIALAHAQIYYNHISLENLKEKRARLADSSMIALKGGS